MVNIDINALVQENEALVGEVQSLQEAMGDIALQIEDVNWRNLGSIGNDSGFTLETLKMVSSPLRDLVHANTLLKRAVDLRHGYCYSNGVNIRGITEGNKKAQGVFNKPANIHTFFSPQARQQRIRTRMHDGNIFILRIKSRQTLVNISLDEITGLILDEYDTSRIMYVKRKWTDGSNNIRENWYKTHDNDVDETPDSKMLGNAPIDSNGVMYAFRYNTEPGWALGVPDALNAMKWAEAYSEYLGNNSKLVRAYARIAHKFTTSEKKAAQDLPVQLRAAQETDTYGSTAAMGQGSTLQALPATGSNVDFHNGRPLASMVAAGLGVSVIALLSDPGKSGTGSIAETLDLPTQAVMRSLQEDEKFLMETILRDMGMPDVTAEFPETMQTDPQYRALQSLAQAYATGAIHQSEYREEVLRLLDVENPKGLEDLPKPDEFNAGHTPGDEAVSDPIPSQGNSGATGTGVGSNNDARDRGEYKSGE